MASLRRIAAPLALGLAAAGVACGDIAGPQAVLSTISDTASVYALNGAPVGAPTALYIFAGSMVRADANFRFDIAFDIDASGKIVLMPVRTVASPLTAAHQVGLQTVGTSYNDLLTGTVERLSQGFHAHRPAQHRRRHRECRIRRPAPARSTERRRMQNSSSTRSIR
jgi:hypothetical protein